MHTENTTTQTVYQPRANLLSQDNLRALMVRVSREELVEYAR